MSHDQYCHIHIMGMIMMLLKNVGSKIPENKMFNDPRLVFNFNCLKEEEKQNIRLAISLILIYLRIN